MPQTLLFMNKLDIIASLLKHHLDKVAEKRRLPSKILQNFIVLILCLKFRFNGDEYGKQLTKPLTIIIRSIIEGLKRDMIQRVVETPDVWLKGYFDSEMKNNEFGPYAVYFMEYESHKCLINTTKYKTDYDSDEVTGEKFFSRDVVQFFGLYSQLKNVHLKLAIKCKYHWKKYDRCRLISNLVSGYQYHLFRLTNEILTSKDYYPHLFWYFETFEYILRTCEIKERKLEYAFKKMPKIRSEVLKILNRPIYEISNIWNQFLEKICGVYSDHCKHSFNDLTLENHNCKAKEIVLDMFFTNHTYYLVNSDNLTKLMEGLVNKIQDQPNCLLIISDLLSVVPPNYAICGGSYFYYKYETDFGSRAKLTKWIDNRQFKHGSVLQKMLIKYKFRE